MAKPRVFVSSTCYDLKHIRASLENFIDSLGFEAVLSEKGDIPFAHDRPLDESCYREVRNCDVFVTILGGRYGSEKSATKRGNGEKTFFDKYDSVTKEEYKAALEKDIPIYVFVEKSVYGDYETYLKNRENTSIVYPHVSSINSLVLIEEILNQPRNNPLHTFEKYGDIEEWLRSQWAGLFQELLRKRTEQQRIASLESQVKELSAINQTLKNYLERIVEKVDPNESKGFIIEEEKKLETATRLARFSETRYVRHFSENHGVPLEEIVKAFENSNGLVELRERLKSAANMNGENCSALRIETMRTNALRDINRSRVILGLSPFREKNTEAESLH